MKKLTKRILALILIFAMLAGLGIGAHAVPDIPAPLEWLCGFLQCMMRPFRRSLIFDLNKAGKVIGNKFSDINIWQMQGGWSDKQPDPAAFARAYPFAERLQIMTATGGNESRDLFADPLDRTTLTDYDFGPLLAACRHITAVGMKPMIKTGAVPLKFCANPNIGTFGVNTLPPDDFTQYYAYIKAIAQALTEEFGPEEVKGWSFGVLTEYENRDWFYIPGADGEPDAAATRQAYFKLYDYTVAALQDALGRENLTVGAHAMQCAEGLWCPRDFINHCAKGENYATGETGTQLDFLSSSFYDSQPGQFAAKNLEKSITQLKKWAKAAGLTGLRFGVDEGRILAGADGKDLRARVVAMSYQGAADARMFQTMVDHDIDWFANWDGATNLWDGGAEPVSTHVAYLGGSMKNDRYIKPMAWGIPMHWRSRVNGVGGYDSAANTARFMVYNFHPDPDAQTAEPLRVTLKNLGRISDTMVTVREYVVDDGHANFWPLWWADQAARGLTDADYDWSKYSNHPLEVLLKAEDRQFFRDNLERYAQAAELKYTETRVPVEGGRITLAPTLQHHGVVFYEISAAG
ncbi:MAG: hypothetical protein FWC27_02460 [Firmicutes bacterium]|nr:hypothetical protein [Bacillota bacterium]